MSRRRPRAASKAPRADELERQIERPPLRVLASVALVSFAVVAFEISLTRVYSVLYAYHFVFLAVSGAVCGLGVGGFAWHLVLQSRFRKIDPGWLALAFAAAVPVTVALLFSSPMSSVLTAQLLGAVIPLLPFSLAGAFLAAAFSERASRSGTLYAADLAGAGLAALAIIPLLDLADPLHLPFLLGALTAVGAAAWAAERSNRLLSSSAVVGLLSLGAWPLIPRDAALGQLSGVPTEFAKPMLRALADPQRPGHIIDSEWSAYARTDLVQYAGVERLQLYTDGDTPAVMEHFNGNLAAITNVDEMLYVPFALGPHRSLLSLGPGGGLDFLMGEMTGFQRLDGVEINASLVRLVERHKDFDGDVYHLPGVTVTVDDGRSAVRRSTEHYDLIVNSLTLTNTGGNVGAALMESYLHTTEAFADYERHLSSNGRYALVAQSRHAVLRAALTALEVMRAQGVSATEGCKRLLALTAVEGAATPYRNVLIWKRAPFTEEELTAARRVVEGGLATAIFMPGGLGDDAMLRELAGGTVRLEDVSARGVMSGGTLLNLRPVTDDVPFFLYLGFGSPPLFLWLLGISLALAAGWTALALSRRSAPAHGRTVGYFSALGVAFMLVEIPLAQKFVLFLGHPTASLAVVLFCLLVGASLGSHLSQRWSLEVLQRRVGMVGLGLTVVLLASSFGLSPLLDGLLQWPLAGRYVVSSALLLPLGVALGVPFPSGLRLAVRADQPDVPWLWGLNGVMSVVGSALAASGPYYVGFSGCLLGAAALYAALGFLCPRPAESNLREVESRATVRP